RAGADDAAIEIIDELRRARRRAGGDLDDVLQAMLAVAGIDALRAVADEELLVEPEPGGLLQDGHADFLGRARVDGGFIDDDVAGGKHAAHGAPRRFQRPHVGQLVAVHRRRHGDDVDIAALDAGDIRGEPEMPAGFQFLARYLAGAVDALAQFPDALRIDVEGGRGIPPSEGDREGQVDIAKPYHADARVLDPEVLAVFDAHKCSWVSRRRRVKENGSGPVRRNVFSREGASIQRNALSSAPR